MQQEAQQAKDSLAERIADLDEAIAAIAALYRRLPAEALTARPVNAWGPRELLCHLVFWHEQYATIAEALSAGAPPLLQPGTFRELNVRAVLENRDCTLDELLARLDGAQQRLAAIAHSSDEIPWSIAFKQGGTARPFPEALRLIAGHIRGHGEQVRRTWLPRRRAPAKTAKPA